MVYFLLGYLGSGKTSALNNMLRLCSAKTAVIINDFGEIDVDGHLCSAKLKTCITGGSIFCSCKNDEFVRVFADVLGSDCQDIIVETSGLANPFTLTDAAKLGYKLANCEYAPPKCITTVDCASFEKLAPIVRMINMQVACADIVLLNKTDLVSGLDIARISALVRQINGGAKIIEARFGKLDSLDFASVNKKLPINILDINTSKCVLKLQSGVSKSQLDQVCERFSAICHRIKGVIDGKVYEYCNGEGSFRGEASGDNFLILLCAGDTNLIKEAQKIISESGAKWIKI